MEQVDLTAVRKLAADVTGGTRADDHYKADRDFMAQAPAAIRAMADEIEALRKQAELPLVRFLGVTDNPDFYLPVRYIANGVAKYGPRGQCAFCQGDPCGEDPIEEGKPLTTIQLYNQQYTATWGHRPETCPHCHGAPS